MAAAKQKPNPVGRPSDYDPAYCETARKFCLLGATDKQLAELFEVSEQTLNAWKRTHPEFLSSIKAGKELADAEVAAALYHRAKGYSHDAVKIFQYEGDPVTVDYIERFPPDVAAASLWLRNRQPERWRDKTDGLTSGLQVTFMLQNGPTTIEGTFSEVSPFQITGEGE
jgi:hypothetical protein